MPKLTGKKKLEFLKRLNKGRVAKGLKAIKAKGSKVLPKTSLKKRFASSKAKIKAKSPFKRRSKANKQPKTNRNVVFKKKGSRSRRGLAGIQFKKLLLGGVTGIALELLLSRLGANGLATDVGYIGASMVGSKSGVIGNALFRQGVSRFGGSLGFLGSGNGNGSGTATNTGFA